MPVEIFACDVSKWQPPVDDSYPRKWLIFRVGDGSMDPNARANLAWCRKALADGRLLGYTGYLVYRPGETPTHLLDDLGYPTDRHVMLDVESWGGQIGGNRSSELNSIAARLQARQGGDASRVWGYGNQNDLARLWPSRPSWIRLVVAGYSIRKPGLPNMVGWQYTDGEDRWPVLRGWPRSSAPFGRCDHNRLYLTDQDIGDDMTPDECRAVVRDEINRVLHDSDGNPVSVRTLIYNGINRVLHGADDKPHSVNTLVWQNVEGVTKLAADVDQRVAALQASVAELAEQVTALAAVHTAQVSIPPQDVTVHIEEKTQ